MPFVKVLRNGQITLPKEVRESLGLRDGEILEVEVKKSQVILKPKILMDAPDGGELSASGKKKVNEALRDLKKGDFAKHRNIDGLIKDLNS
ncbi:hypothetical protein MNBD_NITROSPINAE03-1781 [hydrothermal vent metagenome]|uniref:SpoVT-AbrB domain-containing protein n=1 Tax=hydrothermal vent metagenome TaxID=652676 RepID=A0A3B1C6V3_9ZZZZ